MTPYGRAAREEDGEERAFTHTAPNRCLPSSAHRKQHIAYAACCRGLIRNMHSGPPAGIDPDSALNFEEPRYWR